MGIHFYKVRAWSLVTGLVGRMQGCHCQGLTSVSGWKLKSCFKLPQPEATRDHDYREEDLKFEQTSASHSMHWLLFLRLSP